MCTLACHTSYEPNSFTLMQVRLSMPPPVTKALRSVVERMKTVSRFVGIDASMDGSMVLHANNDTVSIKTYMSNLTAEMGTSYSMLFPFTELMFMCMPLHVEMLCAACQGLPHSHALTFRLRAGVRAQACCCAVAHVPIKGVPSGHTPNQLTLFPRCAPRSQD